MTTDGSFGTGQWLRLTPDNTGNYINGTWSQIASMPAGYAPTFYASAVLPDGRVVIEGGEYNNGVQNWTTLGAIYNPVSNSWISITPPNGEPQIGDASSVVLASGTFMLGACCSLNSYALNASNLTWILTGSLKADSNDEEGWTLLPSGKVLTVDTRNGTNSEIFDPSTGSWSLGGSTIVALSDGSPNFEMGPAVLRPDGTVFATGGSSNTAIYNTATGGWSVGPTLPNGLDIADGPAALLPSGNVLVDSSPGVFANGTQFFEFNGSNLILAPAPANASSRTSFQGRMLVLPTGQILFTDQSATVQIYTSSGTFQSAWQPTITSVAATLNVGSANNSISGTQFNGLSQGSMYGDDAQSATNYPLVRIINNSSRHVFYARTHDHSTMAVATGAAIVSTQFDVPSTVKSGSSILQVVANGIPSNGIAVQMSSTVNQLNVWWPTDGSTQSGTQPFKARLENVALSSYNMYWNVDGGQLNLMSDNTVGGDHKEASVDLSGWNWRDAGDRFGPFSVSFIAKDLSGTLILQKAITIYVAKPTLSIWWPTDGSTQSGTQPFKARLENMSLSSYVMYWSVDGGQLNLMTDNVDHKEASVDLSGWNWRDAGTAWGPFSVSFIGKSPSGVTLQTKTITIYVSK